MTWALIALLLLTATDGSQVLSTTNDFSRKFTLCWPASSYTRSPEIIRGNPIERESQIESIHQTAASHLLTTSFRPRSKPRQSR
jgi:hypothetical protein